MILVGLSSVIFKINFDAQYLDSPRRFVDVLSDSTPLGPSDSASTPDEEGEGEEGEGGEGEGGEGEGGEGEGEEGEGGEGEGEEGEGGEGEGGEGEGGEGEGGEVTPLRLVFT